MIDLELKKCKCCNKTLPIKTENIVITEEEIKKKFNIKGHIVMMNTHLKELIITVWKGKHHPKWT